MTGRLIGIAVLLLLLAIGIPWARRNKRKFQAHNDEMQTWAASHGYRYEFEDNSQYAGLSFYPFGRGDQQHAHRVITGRYGEHDVAIYDYFFTTVGVGGGPAGGGASDTYFAMIVMQLTTQPPWLHVTERKHLDRGGADDAIDTGDPDFDSVYALFARDAAYAKSAMSATVRAGLPARSLSGMHIVDGRLFMWQTRHKHDVAVIDDRLRFAATVAAELPAPTP